MKRNASKRVSRLPTASSRPGIRQQLCRAPKRVTARCLQLLSGHAMIRSSLKDRWGWTDRGIFWRCDKERQCREHLFKECTEWTREIRDLWTAVGQASGERLETSGDKLKSRKGLGFRVRQARARPSNTTIRDLLLDDRYTEAVLAFLGAARVGGVREGAICT